ncbi:PD-(D/E)XK nuclease family protein [Nonomuraea sp. MCN248]|uniref:PD-(D/E)XK nuclease family protein n=1 Tax=Nonomuraea corallina TaxID=2989783 RepID=A0ABT4SMZ3_9ACTN|nr:PD-(D/E)XK nuclease family protein [Nonomuraea corallina]MDA0638440.1 PD-(D/E)XK nuclease family protein [Nonomuraea corallina]
MPRRLYSCTPSRLNAWLDCRRRYRFTYLDRPQPSKGPAWAHNSVGASVHNALAAWWREPYERRTPLTAAVLLTRGWISEGFRDEAQSAHWLDRSRDLVSGYAATLDPSDDPVGVERTVATRTSVIAVSGRIDRLDRRGDELVVVDYKTGRRPLTQDDARSSLALAIYAVAASRMMRTPARAVELHHLPTGEIVQWRHTDESLDRHLRRAEEIGSEAAEADERYRAVMGEPSRTRRPRSGGASASRTPGNAGGATAAGGTVGRAPEAEGLSGGGQGAGGTVGGAPGVGGIVSGAQGAVGGAPGSRGAVGAPAAERAERPLVSPPRVPAELDELFAPSPGPICGWCDFRRHCPEGLTAAPEHRPWDGLAE